MSIEKLQIGDVVDVYAGDERVGGGGPGHGGGHSDYTEEGVR